MFCYKTDGATYCVFPNSLPKQKYHMSREQPAN